jgi:hypothetical protein
VADPYSEISVPTKQGSLQDWHLSKAHTDTQYLVTFKNPHVCDSITKLCWQQEEIVENHEAENVYNSGQGEAQHKKYKKLTLGGAQP